MTDKVEDGLPEQCRVDADLENALNILEYEGSNHPGAKLNDVDAAAKLIRSAIIQCRVDALKREACSHLNTRLDSHAQNERNVIHWCIDYLASRNLIAGDTLEAKYKSLVAQMDKLLGTPCEQIRHQQEMETARYYISELRMFLEASITKGVNEDMAYSMIGAAGTFLERTLPSPPASTGERGSDDL